MGTQRLILAGAVLCGVVPSVGAISEVSAGPSPPLPSVAPHLGLPPRNCPVADPRLVHVHYNNKPNVYPHRYWSIGRGPIAGYSGWELHSRRVTLYFGERSKYGYTQKVFWQLARGAHTTVSLWGWNLRTGQRVWFGHQQLPDPNHNLIAWPAALVRARGGPHLMFVPSSGCFVLEARWKGGGWIMPFAAGCTTAVTGSCS